MKPQSWFRCMDLLAKRDSRNSHKSPSCEAVSQRLPMESKRTAAKQAASLGLQIVSIPGAPKWVLFVYRPGPA